MRRLNRGFLVALLVFAGLELFVCNPYLLKGQVSDLGAPLKPHYESIRSIWEMAYQAIPVRWTTSWMMKQGQFPAWTAYPEGGTPLIGKMQNGVFSPFHIPYYISSDHLMPWTFTAIPTLTKLFAFCSYFLLASLLGLPALSSFLAATLIIMAGWGNELWATASVDLFLPILLALAELYHRGYRPWALWLVPAVVAMSWFPGHFESSARIFAVTSLYFLIRSFYQPWARSERFKHWGYFLAAQSFGAVMAVAQILPAKEYVDWSYNRVWRGRPEFGWIYKTIQKHLTGGDLPLLILGLGAALLFVWALRKALSEKNAQKGGGYAMASLVGLGLAIAALSQVGLDDTADLIFHPQLGLVLQGGVEEYGEILLWIFSLIAVFVLDLSPGIKALGGVLLLGGLINFKMPLLSHFLTVLPIVQSFQNTLHVPDIALGLCLLSLAAIERWKTTALKERLDQLKRIGLCLIVVAGGWVLSRALKPQVCRIFSTGISAEAPGGRGEGGFMGPERANALSGEKRPLRGWSPFPCVSASLAAVTQDNQVVASAPAELLSSGEGCSFFGLLPMPEGPKETYIFAKIILPDGSSKVVRGPRLDVVREPFIPFLFAAASVPLVAAWPWGGVLAYAATVAHRTFFQTWSSGIAPSEFPFRLPGMEHLRSDKAQFRISSFNYNFFQADYANLYGFPDIRNGGDNLDVLPIIYFNFLTNSLLAKPDGGPEQTSGLRLLGLANVKYIVDAPEAHHLSPFLEEFYRGSDMVIYRNKLALPRAQFFEQTLELPITDIRDWERGKQMAFGTMAGLLGQKGFDPQKVLVLHETGRVELDQNSSASSQSGQAEVQVVSYESNQVTLRVQSPRPGYVFLADDAFPGWRATVNGKSAKILRAYLAFRAVAVPAGVSEIRFVYRPLPLLFGLVISGLCGILWLALFLLRGWKISDPVAAAVAPPTSSKSKKQAALLPAAPAAALDGDVWAAHLGRGLLCILLGPFVLYWGGWFSFVYDGGLGRLFAGHGGISLAVNAAACLLLVFFGAAALRLCWKFWRRNAAL